MTFLTVKEAAQALRVTERAVRLSIEKNKFSYRYVNGVGRGGKQLQIALESLPEEAQARYYHQTVTEPQEKAAAELAALTETQREKVFEKIHAVRWYQEFKAEYPRADKMVAFLRLYEEQYPERPLSRRQLNHWETLYNRDGVSGLIDRRGTWNKGVSSIPEDAAKVFLKYWLQEKGTKRGGPSVASCRRLTQMAFPNMELPSVSTFERLARSIPLPTQIYAREGKKAYKDKCEPYIPFDYDSIHTNQQWVADNHKLDVLVRFPDGHVDRPWLICWMDRRSRRTVGFHIIEGEPNADHILDSFMDAVKRCGIPESVLLDNGKDYVVHDLFNRENAYSLANEMKIQVTNAIKFNAKAKPIERLFGTLEYSLFIHTDSYIGSNPKKRAERLNKPNNKFKEDEIISFDECKEMMETLNDLYNNTPHKGGGMRDRTPIRAFKEEITVPLKIAPPQLLAMYCQRRTRYLTVGKNGLYIKELGQHYNDSGLFPYFGKKVYAKYKTADVRNVYCFAEDGEFICIAESVQLGGLDQELTAQLNRQLNSEKKIRRKMMKAQIPVVTAPTLQQLAIEAGQSFETAPLELLPSTLAIDPEKQHQAGEIQREEVTRELMEVPAVKKKVVGGGMSQDEINERMSEYMNRMGG